MSDKITLDSNILIYAFANNNDFRKSIAKDIIAKCNLCRAKPHQQIQTIFLTL